MILPGNRVLMADSSLKPIEQLSVGDQVLDWKGNVETVEGITASILADNNRKCTTINGSLHITETHGLVGVDGNFYSQGDPRYYWWLWLGYVGANSVIAYDWNWAEDPDNHKPLVPGVQIASHPNTFQTIQTVEPFEPVTPTPMFSHRVSGSGTYVVEGFCALAWPKLLWDYQTWQALPSTTKVDMIRRDDNGKISILKNTDLATLDFDYWLWNPQTRKWNKVSTSAPTGGLNIVG